MTDLTILPGDIHNISVSFNSAFYAFHGALHSFSCHEQCLACLVLTSDLLEINVYLINNLDTLETKN